MGSIKIGSTAVKRVYVGSTTIMKVYVGSTLIWSNEAYKVSSVTVGSSSRGMILLNTGEYAVTDFSNHCIKIFKADGTLKLTYGSQGSGTNQFVNPYGICQDKNNYIYVTEYNGASAGYIRKFSYNGTAITYVSRIKMPSSLHQISYNKTRDKLIVCGYNYGEVYQVPTDLSTYTTLASLSLLVGASMTSDGKTLYYTGYYGDIRKATYSSATATSASSTTTIYSGDTSETHGIALSDDDSYFLYVDYINKRIQRWTISTGTQDTVVSGLYAMSIMNNGGNVFTFTGGASDTTSLYRLDM